MRKTAWHGMAFLPTLLLLLFRAGTCCNSQRVESDGRFAWYIILEWLAFYFWIFGVVVTMFSRGFLLQYPPFKAQNGSDACFKEHSSLSAYCISVSFSFSRFQAFSCFSNTLVEDGILGAGWVLLWELA
jgi:hypothetical protein